MVTTSLIGYAHNIKLAEKIKDVNTDFIPLNKKIIIPDDFPTIQQGIDNANPGDTIYVKSGVYKESIVIDKVGISLFGENKLSTIIDVENTVDDAVTISAEDVIFQGFTVTNARYKDNVIWDQSGIVIFSSNVIVKNNIISNNRLGLMSYSSANNLTICDNLFFYDGIFLGNYLLSDDIPLDSIFVNVFNNTVNGRPLYYYPNVHDFVVNIDAGQVILVNCTNITLQNLYLTYTDFSIIFYYCKNCKIKNSTIANTDGELILFYSENNTIENNIATNNLHGICLDIGSKNNIVRNNEVNGNFGGITVITACSGNILYGNKIHDNVWGVEITSYSKNLASHDNIVCKNEIYKNSIGIRIGATYKDSLCSSNNNIIKNNIMEKNEIGVQIYLSEDNVIKNNIFKRNLVSAIFLGCSKNIWQNNYWNRPHLLPKFIFGFKNVGKILIPWVNIDWHPALKPYEI